QDSQVQQLQVLGPPGSQLPSGWTRTLGAPGSSSLARNEPHQRSRRGRGDTSDFAVSAPGRRLDHAGAMSHISLVALVVNDYDDAIAFFVSKLGFDLIEDSPSTTNDGRPKRWVV